jgi:hypothetical protein
VAKGGGSHPVSGNSRDFLVGEGVNDLKTDCVPLLIRVARSQQAMRARTDRPRVASLDLDLSEHLPIGGAPNAHGILDTNGEILSVGTELGPPQHKIPRIEIPGWRWCPGPPRLGTSVVAGAVFNLQRGLNVPQDEDITEPEASSMACRPLSRQARKGVPL